MALPIPNDGYFSHEAYFALEQEQDERFEYVCGEVYAMAGGSEQHSLIGSNILVALAVQLRDQPCRVYNPDMKLHISTADRFFYPDAMVLCEEGERYDQYVESPSIVIEVLSPSTEAYDRGEKFRYYRQIKSLQSYILLSQTTLRAEVYQRCGNDQWLLQEVNGENGIILLYEGKVKIPLAEVYRQVDFIVEESAMGADSPSLS